VIRLSAEGGDMKDIEQIIGTATEEETRELVIEGLIALQEEHFYDVILIAIERQMHSDSLAAELVCKLEEKFNA